MFAHHALYKTELQLVEKIQAFACKFLFVIVVTDLFNIEDLPV